MSIWGLLMVHPHRSPVLDSATAALGSYCEEVVVVHRQTIEEPAGRAAQQRIRLAEVREALSRIPSTAEFVVLVDADAIEAASVERVHHMIERLREHPDLSAVVRGVPVTDAVKRVEGDTLVGAMDRAGLFKPVTPQVFRSTAVDRVSRQAERSDATDLLTLVAGCDMKIALVTDVGNGDQHTDSAGGEAMDDAESRSRG